MKSEKKNRKADYTKIKRKFYLYVLIALLGSVVFTVLLRLFIQKQRTLGDWIVSFLENTYNLRYEDAFSIYQYSIRNNMEIILFVVIAICFLFLFSTIFSRFMKYFDEINTGVDLLIQGDDKQIELSTEMAFMEQKLNTVKQTLEKRAIDARLAEQRKNDLVMYLAHDIKTPLTSVIGYLNLLEEAPDIPMEQKAKYLHITLEKAYRLEKMINEFFEITRYNLQQISLEKGKIDLYYMLFQLADEALPVLSANGNTIKLNADENLMIYGDSEKLARVFNNILKNAAAYSYPNTEIVLSAEEKDNMIIVAFQNQGDTIPPQKLSAIFEKFYRLDDARISNTGGAGLGLSIAKEIISLHGGTITAQSKNNTVSFIITLPITN